VKRLLPSVTVGLAASFVLVPVLLMAADLAATRTALKYLLLPPFGALAYLVFINPTRIELDARHVILAPTLTAVWSWMVAGVLGYNLPAVGLVVLGTMVIMWGTGSRMVVPPMALALLTLLLHGAVRWQIAYPLSVFVFTLAMYAIYRLWLRLPLDRPLLRRDDRPAG
jgi:hypothetical protein